MEISTVADVIRQQGWQRPDQPAFVYGSRTVSFADLDTRSIRVANGLRSEGVASQDRVAFLDKNSPEFFEVLFGAAKLNLRIMDLPIRYQARAYGETNIQRWRHGWLLLRMTAFAALRLKFIP